MRGRRKKSHQASRHCLHVNMSRAGGEGIALVREASCNIPVSVSIPISTSLYKLSFFSNVPFIKLHLHILQGVETESQKTGLVGISLFSW